MSNLYNLEPQPTAKVVLNTTSGDLTIELFAKQTPLASRNFLQHCLDGYYNNTIFHRLVPGFIIQGGDPTGTGVGGISAINNGELFEDEFHSRLKFNRRGLLGMANEGKDSNGSQFFITLDATPELQGKNTMFGRVEGDTIYNLMKMADAEMTEGEGSEKPLYPTKVTGAEVLVNPFEDMVVRAKEAPRTKDEGKKEVKKRKKPAGKNVLSFGGDEGEEEVSPVPKKAKVNPKLVVIESEEPKKVTKALKEKRQQEHREKDAAAEVDGEVSKPTKPDVPSKKHFEVEEDEEESEPEDDRRQRALDKTNADIAALKASMKRKVDVNPQVKEKPMSALEAMIPATSTRGRKRGKAADERGAIDLFKAFKQRLEDLPVNEAPATANGVDTVPETANGAVADPTSNKVADADEAELCDLHFIANCQSCKSWDQNEADGEDHADDDDTGWMAHTLSFAKDTLGKDLEFKRKMAEIEVIDPREKARALKEEKRKDKGKGKAKR